MSEKENQTPIFSLFPITQHDARKEKLRLSYHQLKEMEHDDKRGDQFQKFRKVWWKAIKDEFHQANKGKRCSDCEVVHGKTWERLEEHVNRKDPWETTIDLERWLMDWDKLEKDFEEKVADTLCPTPMPANKKVRSQ